jgi:hypothetical protein
MTPPVPQQLPEVEPKGFVHLGGKGGYGGWAGLPALILMAVALPVDKGQMECNATRLCFTTAA